MALSNTSSRHLQPTTLEDTKADRAMARIPQPFRDFLLSEMCEFPNPEEMLDNVKRHGLAQTFAVMALFNAHVMREKYGPGHPSIPKLMAIHSHFMETGRCPPVQLLSAKGAEAKAPRERRLLRHNPVLNPPALR